MAAVPISAAISIQPAHAAGRDGARQALCGWYAAARNRANVQDPIPRRHGSSSRGRVWVEPRGPKWLNVVGADRYCRRIVGVELYAITTATTKTRQ